MSTPAPTLAASGEAAFALAAQLSILAEGAQSTAAISADPQVAVQARGAAEVLIDAVIPAAQVADRLEREYLAARARLLGGAA